MPVQVNVKIVVAVTAPVEAVPLVGFEPLQAPTPPDPVQLVALVELQVSVEDPPLAMLVGFAVSVTVGAGTTVTVTL
jgi:hypothetical protein